MELCMMTTTKNRYEQNKEGVLLPYRLVETSTNEGFTKAISLFVALKKIYRNGVFYNPSSRKIAALVGCSHSSINKELKCLFVKGLVERRKGKDGKKQIILKGFKHLTKQWGGEVVFIKYGSKKQINEALKAQIAIRHIKTQEYNIGRKQGRNRKLVRIVESAQNYASLSDRNLASLMGVSNSTANRMKYKWNHLGLITLNPKWQVLASNVSYEEYLRQKAFGSIPVHAVYERRKRRILIRLADAVYIGQDCSYKCVTGTWQPRLVNPSRIRLKNNGGTNR